MRRAARETRPVPPAHLQRCTCENAFELELSGGARVHLGADHLVVDCPLRSENAGSLTALPTERAA